MTNVPDLVREKLARMTNEQLIMYALSHILDQLLVSDSDDGRSAAVLEMRMRASEQQGDTSDG